MLGSGRLHVDEAEVMPWGMSVSSGSNENVRVPSSREDTGDQGQEWTLNLPIPLLSGGENGRGCASYQYKYTKNRPEKWSGSGLQFRGVAGSGYSTGWERRSTGRNPIHSWGLDRVAIWVWSVCSGCMLACVDNKWRFRIILDL